MSTNDVPGANPANNDVLAMGSWAEHDDGSLIFVESTEAGRVIYSMFDIKKTPIVEYRDAMSEVQFKEQFTWDDDDEESIKWLWHDKTPFPWDRIIELGSEDGSRFASAGDLMSAAERVAESLRLRGSKVSRDFSHRREQARKGARSIWNKIQRAVDELSR